MKRRTWLLAAAAVPLLARAHHGWSSFDQDRPVYLQGRVASVKWQRGMARVSPFCCSALMSADPSKALGAPIR